MSLLHQSLICLKGIIFQMNNSIIIINESIFELVLGGDECFNKINSTYFNKDNSAVLYYPSNLHCLYYYHNFQFHLILKTDESFLKYKEIIIKDSKIEGEVLVERVER